MKKKIALFLVAALICAGLIISCSSDEKEKPPTPPPVKYKVTFDSDGRPFADGTIAVKSVEVEADAQVGSQWPSVDEDNIGTDTLIGWYEGDTQYTRTTKITKDVALKAKYEAALLTIDTTLRTAVHTNFVINVSPGGTHSQWDGEEEGDNKFTYTVGGIQYLFPITVGFDYNNYDFVDVEYTASQEGTTGGIQGMVLKNYGSSADYPAYAGSITAGENKVVTFELRNAAAGGFAIQKWDNTKEDITIQITKITFRQGGRYIIKFDVDGGTPVLGNTYLVNGTKVGSHLPTNVTKEGFVFAGWVKGTAGVLAGDTVDNSFDGATLKALWLANIPNLAAINVTFANATDITAHGGATFALVTDGFSQTGANYDWIYGSFKVTIPTGATLAHYDKLKLTIEGKAGDYSWKPVWLMAASTLTNVSDASYVRNVQVSNEIQYTQGKLDLELTIIKPLAANLTGTIDVGIMFRAGGSSGGNSTLVEFTNLKFE